MSDSELSELISFTLQCLMQNVGQQYGQGGGSSHQGATYGHTESQQSNGASITRELRQFRKKDADKHQTNETGATVTESHVARVAPHNHYPPRPQDCYRYPTQFPDYSLPSQVKYSEISEHQPLQEHVSPTVIQKAKGKEYMEMCNVPQQHMKQAYPDHINQQAYAEPGMHHHAGQYLQKDPQVHPSYKPESQYYPAKESLYQQLPHQMQKYNMSPQMRKFPENDFLSKLRRIHPTMAKSIMSEHHLHESQGSYQNQMYAHQNQRYMNYPSALQNNPYPPRYTRTPQMQMRFPSTNPHERSISPRRGYSDNIPINYAAIPQRISPNYAQYTAPPPEYAQHYQHRRGPMQEYYPQACRTGQYMPAHQMAQQELPENRVTVSDSIKQYIENWADEETATEMNQVENGRLCKENLRVRDEQSTETVYMINASELQYLENGIPLVASENGIPLVTSENGQYFLKSGVTIDNSTGMVRIIDKTNQAEPAEAAADRVVNLHIMDPLKSDCMLANKPNDLNQRPDSLYNAVEKPRVVVHQNTVIQQSQSVHQYQQAKTSNSLPVLATEPEPEPEPDLDQFAESVFKECRKETVDKNCSPINMDQLDDFSDNTSVICPLKLLEAGDVEKEEDPDTSDVKLKNMPIIDLLTEGLQSISEKNEDEDVTRNVPESRPQEAEQGKVPADGEEFVLSAEIMDEDTSREEEDANKKEATDTRSDEALKEPGDGKELSEESHSKVEEVRNELCMQEIPDEDRKDGEAVTSREDKAVDVDVAEEAGTKVPEVDAKSLEEQSITLSEEINAATIRRTKRIFSVDDIINNIGNGQKPDAQLIELRQNRQITKEFVEKEVEACSLLVYLEKLTQSSKMETCDQLTSTEVEPSDLLEPKVDLEEERVVEVNQELAQVPKEEDSIVKREESVNSNDDESIETATKIEVATKDIKTEENAVEDVKPEVMDAAIKEEEQPAPTKLEETCPTNHEVEGVKVVEAIKGDKADAVNSIETVKEPNVDSVTALEDNSVTEDQEQNLETILTEEISKEQELDCFNSAPDTLIESNVRETGLESMTQNEVQYRNAIRVEENSVLLEIAGELVEITVNVVNGKKMITVVPLSESTIVDFNDNYETLDTTQDIEHFKPSSGEVGHVELPFEGATPEPDVIESTSEIIIGMDISLEEEIQLDLEKPQSFCTKAAKKSYDNDLQIPSITTSEDITDNNKANSYSPNDKVSSSKEQTSGTTKTVTNNVNSSNKGSDAQKKTKKHPEQDKSTIKELVKIRKVKKESPRQSKEEDDFVPFKDLIKERKAKKMKLSQAKDYENVSADSTNKVEEYVEAKSEELEEGEVIDAEREKKEMLVETTGDTETNESEETKPVKGPEPETDTQTSCKVEEKQVTVEEETKEHCSNVNASKSILITEKAMKKVTFGAVKYKELCNTTHPTPKNYKLQDPRLKHRSGSGIMVPSVSELLRENQRLVNNKKKLSLAEYNNRKRKLLDQNNKEAKVKKANTPESSITECRTQNLKPCNKEASSRLKMQRPKSLDDIKLFGKPKNAVPAKRKFSLQVTTSKPNHFDWEETQSPKTNLTTKEDSHKRLSEFRGLFSNKSKIIIDVSDLNSKPAALDNSEDEILQNYKEQVDSKLSSINLQIPRVANILNPCSKSETNTLMQRFLKNEKLSSEDMDKIKRIISYKRLMQQLDKIKVQSPLNPTYEIRKACVEEEMKLHLKKVPEKKKKRFRNLYAESTTESDSDLSDSNKNTNGDYSVVQSNSVAAGVPKLIIKRKTEMPVPVVKLQRLDLGILVNKKRKVY
ncbi:hypothetical protein NQ315_002311 [Exocentrus adspersus]|uniref:Uncharacterized protein n=1 Tax=Exocentrus adspersus TaxID=1586481 RepID=A0AAV8VSK5_9CUCU|nr:hypothetical protein NQ315_002311 [Exocentrus adspersus]